MSQELENLFQEFEKEVWLFLDKDLSETRMNFWEEKLSEFPELYKFISDYSFVSDSYNESPIVDLDLHKFDSMIDKSINTNSFLLRVRKQISRLLSNNSEFAFGKITFASVLIIAAIVISIISEKPNPIVNMTTTINDELLDWNADFVDNQINKVGELLKLTKDDDYRKYYKYKVNSKKVGKNLDLIESNIKSLKEEINNKAL